MALNPVKYCPLASVLASASQVIPVTRHVLWISYLRIYIRILSLLPVRPKPWKSGGIAPSYLRASEPLYLISASTLRCL